MLSVTTLVVVWIEMSGQQLETYAKDGHHSRSGVD